MKPVTSHFRVFSLMMRRGTRESSTSAFIRTGALGLALGVPIGQAEYYTDGYESMTLICPVFTCGVGLLLGFIVVAGAAS